MRKTKLMIDSATSHINFWYYISIKNAN